MGLSFVATRLLPESVVSIRLYILFNLLCLYRDMLIKVVCSSTGMPSVEEVCGLLKALADLSYRQRAGISLDKHGAWHKKFLMIRADTCRV